MNYLVAIAQDVYHRSGHEGVIEPQDLPLYLGYAVLVRAKGVNTTSEDVHDVWSLWASLVQPDHRSLIPFDELSPAVQAYDDLYRDAIREVAHEYESSGIRTE